MGMGWDRGIDQVGLRLRWVDMIGIGEGKMNGNGNDEVGPG